MSIVEVVKAKKNGWNHIRNVETKDFKKQINERKSSFMKTDRGSTKLYI